MNSKLFSNALRKSVEDNKAIYGKFLISEGLEDETEEFSICASLINEYMFKADQFYITKLLYGNEYEVDISDEDKQIFEGYHPYFFEFKAHSNDAKIRSFILQHLGEWIKMELLTEEIETIQNEYVIDGTMIFGASPLILSGRRLTFDSSALSDPIAKKIEDLYSCSDKLSRKNNLYELTKKNINDKNVLDSFRDLLPNDIKFVLGTIYNVGQANNIKLSLQSSNSKRATILFDVGCTYQSADIGNKIIIRNTKSFIYEKFDAIILSHWDVDHISGIEYYNENLLYSKKMIWIAPNVNLLKTDELSASAFRLAAYLSNTSQLYLADSLNNSINIGNRVLEIWQGDGIQHKNVSSNKYEATHNNVIGLLVEIKGFGKAVVNDMIEVNHSMRFPQDVRALLCGDCTFLSIPKQLKSKQYDILVTPHHGTDTTTPDIGGSKNAVAIISAGKVDQKGIYYPSPNHVYQLVKNDFSRVLLTEKYLNIGFVMYT